MSPFLVVVVTVLLSLVVHVKAVDGDIECGTAMACFPWAGEQEGSPCIRGQRMNLRFMLDVAQENLVMEGGANTTVVYGFCPIVDRLETFSLTYAPELVSVYDKDGVPTLTRSIGRKYLSVYGFGMSNSTFFPQKGVSTGAVLIAMNGSTLCGSYRSVALVHTLTLDIGFYKGMFNYIGATERSQSPEKGDDSTKNSASGSLENSLFEAAEVVVQPAMVGFRPTCDANDVCLFDTNSVCVGSIVGKKNCATCYRSPTDIRNARLSVWTSYYGTDFKGRPMRSSGLNPLNYQQFAGNGLFNDISRTLDSLREGNLDALA